MCGGSSAKPPDPLATAQAQQGVNRDALITAAQLNQINQTSPYGSITYTGQIGDPNRTQVTSLDPRIQQMLDSQIGISTGLTDAATNRLGQIPTEAFSISGAPNVRTTDAGLYGGQTSLGTPDAMSGALAAQQFSRYDFGDVGKAQRQIADAGQIQRNIGPTNQIQSSVNLNGVPTLNSDFADLTKQSQDAAYDVATNYLAPRFDRQRNQLESRLAAQGITEGSDAWRNANTDFSANENQAYQQAVNEATLKGNDIQASLFGQSLAARQQGVGEQFDLGNFLNSAQGQQFQQQLASGQFTNSAQQQQYGQNADRARFYNEGQGQDFSQDFARVQSDRDRDLSIVNSDRDYQKYITDTANQNALANRDWQTNSAAFSNDQLARQYQMMMQQQQQDQNWRSQNISENVLQRNQGFNELASFLNGAPIGTQNPTFQPIAQSTAAQASPDLMSLTGSNYQAQQQARSALLSSLFGAAGQAGSAAIMFCWVAREVFDGAPDWLAFREWLLASAPRWVRKLYGQYGERLAEWIRDKPRIKSLVRKWMTGRINASA